MNTRLDHVASVIMVGLLFLMIVRGPEDSHVHVFLFPVLLIMWGRIETLKEQVAELTHQRDGVVVPAHPPAYLIFARSCGRLFGRLAGRPRPA
jgi:hypothetical protein